MLCWQIHGTPKDRENKKRPTAGCLVCLHLRLSCVGAAEEEASRYDGIWLMVARPSESPVIVSLQRTYKSRVDPSSQHSAMFVASSAAWSHF